MTRPAVALIVCALALSACGAAGPPIPPSDREPAQSGITVTGQGRFGVTAAN